ncbi:ATP-binding protein [Mycolicibacterium alvei]|uniref:Helicase HerA central domain-containing protein n=1 Tax=Mycolicibacterium alvei TaxID=67081 RepID=A0A6N4UU45_9MYCO|nr:DUF87 domain-containing protein [Mycolicibacterium alvei]MCV7000947.1 ATP-binding protein [Mycolicibacterium alvei]BBX27184.1 hypothetical protein MALV_23090 [Mycolicibacterium alvei]
MSSDIVSTANLDYIQRVGFEPPPVDPTRVTRAPTAQRSMLRITGIGRLGKQEKTSHLADDTLGVDDLLAGLHMSRVPLAFRIGHDRGTARVEFGTWLPGISNSSALTRHTKVLDSALRSLYPAIDITPVSPQTGQWQRGGLVMGIPTFKLPTAREGVRQVDRLLRALAGRSWSALVLAQPVDDTAIRDLRIRLINEMRTVQTDTADFGVPSPLAESYLQILAGQLDSLNSGQGSGTWRTAVYLLSDQDGYDEAASLWRGIYFGADSAPEPLRVFSRVDVPALADGWVLPDPVSAESAPGYYRHPFEHQTLLTSGQLATYLQLPQVETPGFAISDIADFDVVTLPAGAADIALGNVVERRTVSMHPYAIDPDRLTRHGFISGVTGSGKTNTVFQILGEVSSRRIPFLVIEPAKTEYRALLNDTEIGSAIRVYTLGDEMVSPYRLNPFEVPEGISVSVHLDMLRAVFNASFGMWTPLPQVLETCLHEVYTDRGWDITTNTNHRLRCCVDRSLAFPTLTELVRKVEVTVPELGYDDKVANDISAALRTRLNSLRTGGKGRMLDTRQGLDFAELLSRPTIVELEDMGDDDDKAFLMGLVMIRLIEHRRVQGDFDKLRHLMVIEEAHRLLANTAPKQGGPDAEGDMKGKAVETFSNLLSEIRAYGQGVLVVDQVPTKLAPDVVKNTNLKLAHRLVAGDDRGVIADAMAMTKAQESALATMPVGWAVAFNDGEDASLLLQIHRRKSGSGTWPTDGDVRVRMTGTLQTTVCAQLVACPRALKVVETPSVKRAFSRVVLSAIYNPGGLARTWPDVVALIEPMRPPDIDRNTFLRCVIHRGAEQWSDAAGARGSWPFDETSRIATLIGQLISAAPDGHADASTLDELRGALRALRAEGFGPFPACSKIWASDAADACACAVPVAELVASGQFNEQWTDAGYDDRAGNRRQATWDVCTAAAFELIEVNPFDARDADLPRINRNADRLGLCFAQQMLGAQKWTHPVASRRALIALFAEQQLQSDPQPEGAHDHA